MPAPDPRSTPAEPGPGPTRPPAPDVPAPDPDPLAAARLERLAELVADGEVEYPAGLTPEEAARLDELVRRRLRAALVRHVARCIALEIWRDGGPRE